VIDRHPALSGDRPLVFAHRGGGLVGPENTLAAFDQGLALGADGLELDVHLSRDEVAVVHHDRTLERTTSGAGPLAARAAAELAALDAAYFYRPEDGFPLRGRGVGIPRLTDVLARYPHVPLIIELKGRRPALARAVVEAVRRAEAVDRVCLGGASWRVQQAVRALEPRLATGAAREEIRWALYRSWVGLSPSRRCRYRVLQVPETAGRIRIVTPRFIRCAHRAGLPVQVWTVNDPADMRRLLAWGADALITDRPDLAVPIVRDRAV
jgi:glycerophosphoryl diester phosphodiesterase